MMRQLAAVLFADIVGFTQMMSRDEATAMKALSQFKAVVLPIVKEHHGIWHKDLGDGGLCSFGSALNAVRSAVDIQKKIRESQLDFKLRVGIHLGDITFQDNDVFGDGVNIAARIQSEASPSGICISPTVFQSVHNRREFRFTSLGRRLLKGVDESLQLYQVELDHESDDTRAIHEFPRESSELPLVVVLPFDNLDSDEKNNYFSYGLADELITELSRIKSMRVISRNSSMKLKDAKQDLKSLYEQLNCRYILQGSVRRAKNNLRISAQLVDVRANTTLWAERYKGTPEDIFDFQEEVARSIVRALNLQLSRQEDRQLSDRPFANPIAYDHYLKARANIYSFREASLQQAKEDLLKGQELIGDNPVIIYGLGMVEFQILNAGISNDPKKSLEILEAYSNQLLDLAPNSHFGDLLKGLSFAHGHGDLLRAIPSFIKAFNRDSQNPDIMVWLGVGLMSTGQLNISRQIVETLTQIDPLQPLSHLLVAYHAFFRGEPSKGLPDLEKSLAIDPEVVVSLWAAVRMYAAVDDRDRAQYCLDRLKDLVPASPFAESAELFLSAVNGDFTILSKPISETLEEWATRDAEWGQILVDAYGLAGLTDPCIQWMEISSKAGFINFPFLAQADPYLNKVRSQLAFQKSLHKIEAQWIEFNKLVEDLMRS